MGWGGGSRVVMKIGNIALFQVYTNNIVTQSTFPAYIQNDALYFCIIKFTYIINVYLSWQFWIFIFPKHT